MYLGTVAAIGEVEAYPVPCLGGERCQLVRRSSRRLLHRKSRFGRILEGLSPEALERPCTVSCLPGKAAWRAKAHFAHLTANERNIQILLRLALNSETSLPGNLGAQSREERVALANHRNQSFVNAHRDDTMETLAANLAATRQETLLLLEQFTDAQLAAPVSVSFVADRTAGELFAANAQHADAHIIWIEEGWRRGLERATE